jgi:hypothetical protein
MEDDDLLYATEVCLKNLERVDHSVTSPDRDLQLIIVPELWERIRTGTRDKLRRTLAKCTLAEYDPDPAPPSIFRRLLSRVREGSNDLRQRLKHAAQLDVPSLVEQARFMIAGSHAADRWGPDAYVYETVFVYRLVPAIAWRALVRDPGAPS